MLNQQPVEENDLKPAWLDPKVPVLTVAGIALDLRHKEATSIQQPVSEEETKFNVERGGVVVVHARLRESQVPQVGT